MREAVITIEIPKMSFIEEFSLIFLKEGNLNPFFLEMLLSWVIYHLYKKIISPLTWVSYDQVCT